MGFHMEEKLGPLLDRGEGNIDDIITPRYVEMSQVSKDANDVSSIVKEADSWENNIFDIIC